MLSESSAMGWRGGGMMVQGSMSISAQLKIYSVEQWADPWPGARMCWFRLYEWEICYSHCNLISSPVSWTVTVSVTWAPVWIDGQCLTFRLEPEKELIFSLGLTVIVIPSHWNLLSKDFISYNVSSTFHRSDKTWSVTRELLMGAKVHIPPSCSQQELVWHTQWLIREL